MTCFLCGREDGYHHLGCAVGAEPELTESEAIERHLLPPKPAVQAEEPSVVEVLKEGSMTTVPVEEEVEEIEEIPLEDKTSDMCEFATCNNPKWSSDPRAKWCEEHRDPKSRKE